MYLRAFRLVCPAAHVPLVEALLMAEGYRCAPDPLSPWCRRLVAEPRPLGGSLAAFFGYVYIQDRSSMLPPLALFDDMLRPRLPDDAPPAEPLAVLDMCASPGSKTGFAAQLAGEEGLVLGNEPSRDRLATLRANMQALGLPQVCTCSHEGQALPLAPGSWRRILLDPPCSGWGTEAKNPRVRSLWHGEKIRPLIALQRQLLAHAARLLAPGGVLSYSTCTTNTGENEEQVRYALDNLGLTLEPLPDYVGVCREQARAPHMDGVVRVDGERSGAQGFFIARLRRPGTAADVPPTGPSAPLPGVPLPRASLAAPCVDPGLLPAGEVMAFGDRVRFVPRLAFALPATLRWQAPALGRFSGGRVRLHPRTRLLLPSTPPPQALVLSRVEELRALLQGQSLPAPEQAATERDTGLYWASACGVLPLGRVLCRKGRAVWGTASA